MYMLKSLVPYTEANLRLAFKPHSFFNELERIEAQEKRNDRWLNRDAMRRDYYKLLRGGYVDKTDDHPPRITDLGQQQLELYEPRELDNALLLVIFDIEERSRSKRDSFRHVLRTLKFTQVQKSVWISKYDSRNILSSEIKNLRLEKEVVFYEAQDISQTVRKMSRS